MLIVAAVSALVWLTTTGVSWEPMMLRATAIPRARAAELPPPKAIEAATAMTFATIFPVELADTVTLLTGAAAVPRVPPMTAARVVDRMRLVDSDPPPARASAGVLPAMARATATATDSTVMSELLVAVMKTPSGATTTPGE